MPSPHEIPVTINCRRNLKVFIYPQKVPYGPSASKSIRKLSRESRSKSSESHARTKFANTQLSNMLKSHILTQNHCEYALTTLEEPPENIKLPKPATDKDTKPKPIVTTPSPVGGSKPKEESPKPVKNKAEKSLRKSARNVEKQKKEMQKKNEKERNCILLSLS